MDTQFDPSERESEVWKVGPFEVTIHLTDDEMGEIVAAKCDCADQGRENTCKHINWVSLVRSGPSVERVDVREVSD